MVIQERYQPIVIAANSTTLLGGASIAGFLCQVSGTVTLVANPSGGAPQTTLLSGFPVTAGVYYPIPFYIGTNGGTFVTSGGAAGLLGV